MSHILGDASFPNTFFTVLYISDRGLFVFKDMRMQPSPSLYMSIMILSSGFISMFGPLVRFSPVDHERVLHDGHLRGGCSERENHL